MQQYYNNPSYPNNIAIDTLVYDWLNDSWITINHEYDYFGQIYVATHGRGMFKSSTFSESKELDYYPIISSEIEIEGISVYPNPTSDLLFLDFSVKNDGDNVLVSLFDIQGKLLNNLEFNNLLSGNYKKQMDFSYLNNGIYIVKIIVDNKTFESKIVKR